MDWRLKALLQLAFSMIPQGEELNYFVQRYVVRSLPVSNVSITASVSYAKMLSQRILIREEFAFKRLIDNCNVACALHIVFMARCVIPFRAPAAQLVALGDAPQPCSP